LCAVKKRPDLAPLATDGSRMDGPGTGAQSVAACESRRGAMTQERDFSTKGGRERWFADDLVRSWKSNLAHLEAELVTVRHELREAEAQRERIYHDYPPDLGR